MNGMATKDREKEKRQTKKKMEGWHKILWRNSMKKKHKE